MSLTRRTIQDVVDEIREDLTEPYAPPPDTTNFWSQAYIVQQINRGIRQVWQTVRSDQASEWMVRKMRSSDPPLTIYGESYNPAGFQGVQGRNEFILPPDLGELLFLEPVLNTVTNQTAAVRFRYEMGLNGIAIRELSRMANFSLAEYWGAVVQRQEGPRFVFRPAFSDTSVHFEMEYVVKPQNYALTDSLEGLGLDDVMLDAVQAYAVLRCLKKSEQPNPTKVQQLEEQWRESLATVIKAVTPLQTVEYETANGFLPDTGGW